VHVVGTTTDSENINQNPPFWEVEHIIILKVFGRGVWGENLFLLEVVT